MIEWLVNLWQNHRTAVLAAGAVLGIALVAGGYALLKRPGDISNPEAAFTEQAVGPKPVIGNANWPFYGLNQERTRYLNAPDVTPPYKVKWRFKANRLLEYSPILVEGSLYGINNNGRAFSVKTRTGKARWKREIASLNASAPAFSDGYIYISTLEPGRVQARDARGGEPIWSRDLPGRTESSPVVVDDMVIAGCECGTLYAFHKRTGKTIWERDLGGEIKAAPAVNDGIIYIGTYGGDMNAIRADDGSVKWTTGSQGGALGQTGRFYATATLGFGRVYAGSLDGRMYSFEQETGDLAWSQSTGGYVYAAAVLADTPATEPTVYFGSYDGTFYALDARSGDERWSEDVGGSISGAASLIGETVYVADLDTTRTHGYNAENGEKVFEFRDGAYNPVISDGVRLYLTGYKQIYALVPTEGQGQNGIVVSAAKKKDGANKAAKKRKAQKIKARKKGTGKKKRKKKG
jgi:outer membrane protein assembly factor BamB